MNSLPTSKELMHERAQTIGLTSCPEDADGKECELCAEQVDRLREAQHRATLASLSPQTGLDWEKAMQDVKALYGPTADLHPLYDLRLRDALNAQVGVLLAAKEREVQRLQDEVTRAEQTVRRIRGEAERVAALEGALKGALPFVEALNEYGGAKLLADGRGRLAQFIAETRTLLDGGTR